MGVIRSKARALFNLGPIATLMETSFDMAAVGRWAASGGKLTLAVVALDSGRLRYVTEFGQMIERDGTSVLSTGSVPTACVPLAQNLTSLVDQSDAIELDRRGLQADLSNAAPGEKGDIVIQINSLNASLLKITPRISQARTLLEHCSQSYAAPSFQLSDLRPGILASASIPGIFPPVQLNKEYYVDGGIRESIPIQSAVDLGATRIYAIHASSRDIPPFKTPAQAGILEISTRALTQIAIDEIDLSDRLISVSPGTDAPTILHIEPYVDLHDFLVIDPGLIQIARDYGYMSAADALAGLSRTHRRSQLATEIATTRAAIWQLENQQRPPSPPFHIPLPVPDPALQPKIDAAKATLRGLV